MNSKRKRNKLVYGVGINDADYPVYNTINSKKLICPFYRKWKSMLARCYSDKYLGTRPTYVGCSVIAQWLLFSNFKSWMEQQDWADKVLDKDILVPGNKIYSHEACVFVDQKVNAFLTESNASRGEWPIGVSLNKSKNRYESKCCSVETGKQKNLGLFKTPEEAYDVWLAYKLKQAYILAAEQVDIRVAQALIGRYSI